MFLKVVIISIYIGLLSGCTGSLSAEKLFFQSVEKEFGPVNAYTIIFSDFPNEKETLVAILNTPDEELYSKGLPSAGEFGYSLFTTYLPFYAKTAAGDTLDRYLYSFNDLLDFLTAENPEGCFYWFYRPPSNDEVEVVLPDSLQDQMFTGINDIIVSGSENKNIELESQSPDVLASIQENSCCVR